MLIVCPACASEYTLDPDRVGAQGRTVRCAKCRESWFVGPAAADPMAGEPLRGTLPESEPAPLRGTLAGDRDGGPSLADAPSAGLDAPLAVPPAEASAPEAPPDEPTSEPVLPVEAENRRSAAPDAPASPLAAGPARRRTRPVRQKPARSPANLRAAACLACLAVLAALVLGRASVVKAAPATARLYAAIGLPVNLRGLAFADVRSEIVTQDGGRFLVVEGEIANVSGKPLPVPPVEIAVRGADFQPLYTWTSEPQRSTLEPAEASRFRARLASPPAEGHDVLVRFLPETGGAAGPGH